MLNRLQTGDFPFIADCEDEKCFVDYVPTEASGSFERDASEGRIFFYSVCTY